MSKRAFVVSDIHGCADEFDELMKHWKFDEQQLVILGDLIDRGPNSLRVVQHVKFLKEKYGEQVIVLQGNHDQMLGDFVENPALTGQIYFAYNGGTPTIKSFINNEINGETAQLNTIVNFLKEHRKAELDFLKQGHLFYEFGKVLFTHAGFCSWAHSWEETTDNQFVWIRDHYRHKNKSGYVNVFGHTPTQLINKDQSNNVWVSDDKLYIGIDGACAYGGQLNGIVIDDNGRLLETYNVAQSHNHEITR